MNTPHWRQRVYLWAEHPARNALFMFLVISLIALAFLIRSITLYGRAYLSDPVTIGAYLFFPTLFAAITFAALQFARQERHARDLTNAILENAPIDVFMTDVRGTITFANKMHMRTMGATQAAQATGVNVFELADFKGSSLPSAFRSALAGERLEVHDLPFTSPQGKSSFLSGFIVPLRDPRGRVSGLLVLMDDVTVQHQLQEETRHARETLQRTIDSIADVVYVIDRQGHFRFVNRQLEKISHYTSEQLVGKHYSEYIPPESYPIVKTALEQVIESREPVYREIQTRQSDGKLSEVGIALAPIQDRDEIVITQHDMTATKRLSRELAQRTDEAERRAHEFQTLYQISLAIGEKLDLDELTQVVYERVRELMPVDVFFLARYSEAEDQVRFEKWIEEGKPMPPFADSLEKIGGLAAWIIRHNAPILTHDMRNDPNLPAQPIIVGNLPRSWLGVPLVSRNHVVGVLSVQTYAPDKYDEQDQRLLTASAGLIAIALENATLFEQTRSHSEEMAAANEIAHALSSTLKVQDVVQLFFARVTELFSAEAGALFLRDPITNELVFEFAQGISRADLNELQAPILESIASTVMGEGKPLVLGETRLPPGRGPAPDSRTNFSAESILVAPFKTRNQVIGAVELFNRRDGNPFTDEQAKLLETFATSAAVAVENARLHERTEKNLAEVSTLYTLANQLGASLELEQIYLMIVSSARQIFTCQAAVLQLLDPEKNHLISGAQSGLEGYMPVPQPLGVGASGLAARDARLVAVPDTAQDERIDARWEPTLGSLLVAPLTGHNRVMGILRLDHAKPNAFTQNDERLLSIVAAQASSAIENALLYAGLRERANKLGQAYEELKELDRLKTEFVQNISHELRTPLTFIKGYAEILLGEMLGPLSAKQQESLRVVKEKTDSLIRLVNDILLLQQMESLPMQVKPVSFGDLTSRAVRGALAAADAAGIAIRTEIPTRLMAVNGDPDRLMQVWDNLIGNALKFSAHGSEVRIRISEQAGEFLAQITDHGIGIPAEELERIFDRFYQVDGSTTRAYVGAGLGLAIVKRIVEAHNGHIWVESEPQRGSTFYFTIPKPDGNPLPPHGSGAVDVAA